MSSTRYASNCLSIYSPQDAFLILLTPSLFYPLPPLLYPYPTPQGGPTYKPYSPYVPLDVFFLLREKSLKRTRIS